MKISFKTPCKHFEYLLIFILIWFPSCMTTETRDTKLFNDLDYSKLILVGDTLTNHFYIKAFYNNNILEGVNFIKNNKIIEKDTVYYYCNKAYWTNVKLIKYKSVYLEFVKISFTDKSKLKRYYLFRKKGKYYLGSGIFQIDNLKFSYRIVNSYKYCIEFKDIGYFIKRINDLDLSKYYFTEYWDYEFKYTNKKLLYKEYGHYKWGDANIPFWKEYPNLYNNAFLDLDRFIGDYYMIHEPILKCLDN
jgi:hypothetical protein